MKKPILPPLKRRGFLKLMGIASAAPMAPLVPAASVRAATVTGGASVSKALWAGIYAKSGSASGFVGVAKSLGLSNTAIQGIGVRSIGVRIALAASNTARATLSSGKNAFETKRAFRQAIERYVRNVRDEVLVPAKDDARSANKNEEDQASKPHQ